MIDFCDTYHIFINDRLKSWDEFIHNFREKNGVSRLPQLGKPDRLGSPSTSRLPQLGKPDKFGSSSMSREQLSKTTQEEDGTKRVDNKNVRVIKKNHNDRRDKYKSSRKNDNDNENQEETKVKVQRTKRAVTIQ